MTSLALLVFSIIPLAVLGFLFRAARRAGLTLRTVILGATLFHEAVLVVFPIWYSVFTGFYMENEINASPDQLLRIMIGETIFVALFGLSMSFVRTRTVKPWNTVLSSESNALERLMVILLGVLGLLINVSGFLMPVETIGEAVRHAEITISQSWQAQLWAWIQGCYSFPALVAAALLVVEPKIPKFLRLLGAASLAVLALDGLSSGVRGRLTWVVSLLVIVGYLLHRKKPIYVAVGALLLMLPLSVFLTAGFRSIYFTELEGASRVQALSRLFESVKTGEIKDPESEGFVASVAHRAQGPRNSISLYELYDTGQSAGFKPLSSAVYMFVPRVFWPEKRPAGSTDETNYGAAIYLAMLVTYGGPIQNMGPILASAHAYWEWGWLGVVLCGVITGLFWNFLLTFCERSARPLHLIVVLSFAASLLIDGFLTALYPLYAIVKAFWLFVLPTLMFYFTILWVSRIIQGTRVFTGQLSGTKKVAFAQAPRKTT